MPTLSCGSAHFRFFNPTAEDDDSAEEPEGSQSHESTQHPQKISKSYVCPLTQELCSYI